MSAGLKVLVERGLVERGPEGRGTYRLGGYDPADYATERVSGEASGGSVIRLLSRPGQSDVDTSGGSKVVYEK